MQFHLIGLLYKKAKSSPLPLWKAAYQDYSCKLEFRIQGNVAPENDKVLGMACKQLAVVKNLRIVLSDAC